MNQTTVAAAGQAREVQVVGIEGGFQALARSRGGVAQGGARPVAQPALSAWVRVQETMSALASFAPAVGVTSARVRISSVRLPGLL